VGVSLYRIARKQGTGRHHAIVQAPLTDVVILLGFEIRCCKSLIVKETYSLKCHPQTSSRNILSLLSGIVPPT